MVANMRGGSRSVVVVRQGLIERLGTAPLVLIEAPGGYGKSTICGQLLEADDAASVFATLRDPVDTPGLLASLGLGFRRAGLAHLAEAIDPDDAGGTLHRLRARLQAGNPVGLVVDEVQRLSTDAASRLAELAEDLPAGLRLICAGRRLGGGLARVGERAGASRADIDDLRFTADEVAVLLAGTLGRPTEPGDAMAILALTDGWPAAAVLAARSLATRPGESAASNLPSGPAGISGGSGELGPGVLRRLVRDLLAGTEESTKVLCGAICELPLLSAEVIAAVGGSGGLDRLLDAGVPIRFRPDGWGELADPVRDLLAVPNGISTQQRRSVAVIYAEADELGEAIALLHRADDGEGVLSLLAGQRRDALSRAGLALLDASIDNVSDVELARHPDVLVELVRAAEHQPRLREAFLARARSTLIEASPAWRAVEAERALDQARGGDLAGATTSADAVLAAAGPHELATCGRGHLAHAVSLLVQDTAGSTAVVAEELDQAAALFRLAGEHSWEAYAHKALGYGCHFTTGAYELAVQRLDRALALQPAADAARADTLTYVAEVLSHLGRLDDAEVALREASAISHRLGDHRTIAYTAWSMAELCCQRRDAVGAMAALDEAQRHPDGWFDRLAGIDFLAHSAEILAILGDRAGAWLFLRRAEDHAAGTARADAPVRARVRLEATFGDPAAAIQLLERLESNPLTYQSDRWLRLLLKAVCAARLGRREEATELLDRCGRAAADVGDADLPARREPELVALASDATPPSPQTGSSLLVVLLGRFAIAKDGVDVTPPPGRPATLVKLVALRRRLAVDEAVDVLWPDADLDSGSVRLRNVLSRIKASSGTVLAREGATLVLAPNVEVDAPQFEAAAGAALAARGAERAGLARRALARWTGELLPGDRYEDWSVSTRERLRRRYIDLVDVVVDDCISRGELDEAARLLDVVTAEDSLEESRYVRLARTLLAQGRSRRARGVLRQAASLAAELNVEPSQELRSLLATIGAPVRR